MKTKGGLDAPLFQYKETGGPEIIAFIGVPLNKNRRCCSRARKDLFLQIARAKRPSGRTPMYDSVRSSSKARIRAVSLFAPRSDCARLAILTLLCHSIHHNGRRCFPAQFAFPSRNDGAGQ